MSDEPGAKVVSLRGDELASPGQPDKNVVSILENLLEQARAGEIAGVVGAVVYADSSAGEFGSGRYTAALLGSLHLMAAHVVNRITGR